MKDDLIENGDKDLTENDLTENYLIENYLIENDDKWKGIRLFFWCCCRDLVSRDSVFREFVVGLFLPRNREILPLRFLDKRDKHDSVQVMDIAKFRQEFPLNLSTHQNLSQRHL